MTDVHLLQPTPVRDILGKTVYSTTGFHVGEVVDVEFERDTGDLTGLLLKGRSEELTALGLHAKKKKTLISFTLVTALGDIVLVDLPGAT